MAHTFIHCTHCGKTVDLEAYRLTGSSLVAKMRSEQLCFDCAYWLQWLLNPETGVIVVNGAIYKMTEDMWQPSAIQSRASDMKFIVNPATLDAYAVRGLVLRGRIPKHFQTQIPNQYKFISRDTYHRFMGYEAEMCMLKGCFDRYHCVWYNPAIAEPDGPWNTIPKNYQIGSEDCPSFINKHGITND